MSALTKAKVGQRVTFKKPNGQPTTGLALRFASDSMLVGCQNEDTPYLKVVHAGGKVVWTANNSVWVVPYTHVVEVSIP